ncbi:hypothetical protein ACQ4PT_041812 [Festuca glaucescens]
MDAATPSKRARTTAASASIASTPQKLKIGAATLFADQVAMPEKPAKKVPAASSSAAHPIWTPEKTEQRPLRRKGFVGVTEEDEEEEEEDALESVARELGVSVGASARRSPVKRRPEVKLPESYEMLCEFFNCFESSTRLLRMKGSKATFPNICAIIQKLTDRRFTYGNLAQLKYIMPEAFAINKILLRDESTCCMKPDLQVNLLVSAVKGSVMQKEETRYSALRRIFRQKVVDFFKNHPQGDDIPEHELPHPFTQTKPSVAQITPRAVPIALSTGPSPSMAEQHPVGMSHMPHSFKRMFSQRYSTCPATASATSSLANPECTASSPLSRKSVPGSVSGGTDHESHVALRFGDSEGTPAKFASTPVRLLAATPGLHTPKMPISATMGDSPPLTVAKRSARANLFMTPTKDASSMQEENQSTSTSVVDGDDELLSFLPKALLQSVKEKEKSVLEDKVTGFADQVQRKKLISSLPSTFDTIFLIYQSRQQSVLTKQELLDKIIGSNPKILDKGEIEEQLRLLQEFIPEWISEKTALSGGILCCVDTSLSQSEIRQRLNSIE